MTAGRAATTGIAALVLIAAVPSPLPLRLGSATALLLGVAAYATWLGARGDRRHGERPAAAPDPQLADVISARVGEPTHAAVPFVLRTQHAPQERWHGEEALWIAVSDTWIWLLNRGLDGSVGGVKSRFSRAGLHARWIPDRHHSQHLAELSWPADPWFIAGDLHGACAQRLRLIGLLAADELGLRHLVTRTRSLPRPLDDDRETEDGR
jgi:hypothetical protein